MPRGRKSGQTNAFILARTAEIVQLLADGATVDEIAAAYNITTSAVYAIRAKGVAKVTPAAPAPVRVSRKVPNNSYNLSREDRLKIAKRYALFEDVQTIANEYGLRHKCYVQTIARDLGYGRGRGPGVMEAFKEKLHK